MRKCDTFYGDGQIYIVAFDCDREIEENLKYFEIYIVVNYSSRQANLWNEFRCTVHSIGRCFPDLNLHTRIV
jgi:hypothetical protein